MQKFIELFFKRYKLFTSIFVIVFLFFISYLIYINRTSEVQAINTNTDELVKKVKESVKVNKIKVDVKGMVNNPGVYEIDDGSRVIDAINAAGGISEEADTSTINLSKKLKDENVIIVESTKEPDKVIEYVYKECNCPKFNDACLNKNDIVNYQESKNNSKSNDTSSLNVVSGPISINSATKEELQTLSGVGESKAVAIIKYREENGPFNSLEDIMNVSGIGNSLFEKIKDNITL